MVQLVAILHPSLRIRGYLGLKCLCICIAAFPYDKFLRGQYLSIVVALILCSINDAINRICPLAFPLAHANIKARQFLMFSLASSLT
jgi:hypothetical protein